jgi:hypothetical protein
MSLLVISFFYFSRREYEEDIMARRKTHEEFCKEVYNLVGDEYTILDTYQKRREKILIRHNSEKCNNNEWYITPDNFLGSKSNKGRRYPVCAGRIKKDTESFKYEVYKAVGEEYSVLGNYINSKTKIRIRHNKCNNEWDIPPASFISGNRCGVCAGNRKKTTEQFKQEVYLINKDFEVLGEYINSDTKIKIKHTLDDGEEHVFEIVPWSLLKRKRCTTCSLNNLNKDKLLTHEEFVNRIYTLVKDEYEILGNYVNSTTPIRIKHKECNYEWDVYPNNFMYEYGSRCPNCVDLSGEKNGFWKGGITSEAQIIRTSKKYLEWRNGIYKRDDYTCVCCGEKGGKINAHHLESFSTNPDLRFDDNNAVTLCENHHKFDSKNSFHNIYGTYNNTKKQFEEYLQRYKSGEFDNNEVIE